VYEPANLPDQLFSGEAAARVALPDGPGPQLEAVERALQGRVHGDWVDQLAEGHVFSRRVVKDVRAVGLLPIVAARHPASAVVVLVRHPLAVARSVVALGWTTGGDPGAAMLDEVRRWCALHGTALRAPASRRAHVVAYEHLVAEPDATLDAVLAHLGRHHPTWRDLAVDRDVLARPSATSFRRDARSGPEWVGTLDDLDADVRRAAVALLADAGLGSLYGDDPRPLVGPDDLDAAARGG